MILQSELDRALNNVLAQYANRQDQLPPRDVLQRQVLERLILVRLQTARAAETGVRVSDEEIDTAISNIATQNKLTPDQLRQQLARDGMSYDDFRGSLRDELLTQRLRQRFAQTRISVSEAEVDAALSTQVRRAVPPRPYPDRAARRRHARADRDRRSRRSMASRRCSTRASWISPPPRCAIPTAPMRWKAAISAGAASTRFPLPSPTPSAPCRKAR